MAMRSLRGAMFLFLSMTLAACGSSSGGTTLDRSKNVGSLTPAEQAQLCDDVIGTQGGYGRSVSCPDGSTQTTDADRASCMQSTPTAGQPCSTLTVGTLLDCATAVGSNLCAFTTASACQPLHSCAGM
jgi:hypothetical protein